MGDRWIKLNTSIFDHPSIVTIASRLGVTDLTAVGAATRFWCLIDAHGDDSNVRSNANKVHHDAHHDAHHDENDAHHDAHQTAESGPVLRMTKEALDSKIGLPGFCDAMIACDWLVEIETGLMAPRYHEHNGPTAKKRALSNRRKAIERGRKRDDSVTNTRPDKIREDKIREKKKKLPCSTPKLPGVERSRISKNSIESIYQTYPRKVGKSVALKSIAKALALIAQRNGVTDPVAWLTERVTAYAQSPAGNAGEFTPHPSTWFNQGRYDDDPKEWSNKHDNDRSPARLHAPKGKYDGIEIELKV